MGDIFTNLKRTFNSGNILAKLIYINVGLFVFILAASVDVALISFSGSLIHPVKWNFTDLSRMSFVDSNCVI